MHTCTPARLRAAVRSLVLASALVGALAAAVPAHAANPTYWYAGAQTKVYKTTITPSSGHRATDATARALSLRAARAEAEGRQIVVRAWDVALTDVWLEPSDLTLRDSNGAVAATIPASKASVYKVHYVFVDKPSWGQTRRGYQPDALIPMKLVNGERLGWRPGTSANLAHRSIAKGMTQPFYVLFQVPDSARAGTYEGTVTVTAKAADGSSVPRISVPIRLTVYPFSIARRTLPTSFGMSLNFMMYANSARHKWLGQNPNPRPEELRIAERTDFKADQLRGWYQYMSDHRVSPQSLMPAWDGFGDWSPGSSNGTMNARTSYLNDYLGTGTATTFSGSRFGFNSFRMPEFGAPSFLGNPFASSTSYSNASRYYRTMKSELGTYASRGLVYPIDEPKESKRGLVEKYAAFVHKVAPGLKYFVTASGSDFGYRLIRGVDIYGQKLHFRYRDYSRWIAPIKKAGKKVWIYSHAGTYQSQTPNYLIDKTLVDPRAQGWFAYHTKASGLLYFNISAWRPHMGSSTYRDPYKDPLSFRLPYNGRTMNANGDGSLVYPGYYPSLGLVIAGSPPVGSLRMEALRDGLEDYEYFKLLEAKSGRASTGAYLSKVIGKPSTVVMSGKPTFPAYSKSPSTYESARNGLAAAIMR